MKKLLLIAMIVLSQSILADGISVISFKLLETDLTANTRGTERRDQNGDKAALIKIVTPERGFRYDGGSLGIVGTEEKTGEIWLYVPPRAQKLTISHQVFGVMRDYYYPTSIQGGRTYEMLLDIGTGRYVTITTSQAKSDVTVDGEYLGKSPIYNKYMTYGRHAVFAQNDIYEGNDTIIVATTDAKETKMANIQMQNMSDQFGEVYVNVDDNAEIWYNGRQVGTGSWFTQLRKGAYTVETRKVNCDPVKTNFTVQGKVFNRIQANAPSPHIGLLNVYTRPRNVRALLNGANSIDLTTLVGLPIGTYQVDIYKQGYFSETREYTIEHNRTTTDTINLQKIEYIKDFAFYFGAGYTYRQMGGVYATVGCVLYNFDLQASYTLGLHSSDPVRWYTADGNYSYMSSVTYKRSTLAAKLGYQIRLSERLGLTPQVGFYLEQLTGTVADGTNLYGDKCYANSASAGAKFVYAPLRNFQLFVTPEYAFGLQKDQEFNRIEAASDIAAGGFMITAGMALSF
jgi:hypothetical protein